MLLERVVDTSGRVAATRARKEKVSALAALLRELAPEEIETTVGFLTGEARQGRVGIGWATLAAIDTAGATTPSITIGELDAAISEVEATTGAGSNERRRVVLRALLSRATTDEVDFMRRLLLGELRQGALAGLMNDAIAKAAEVPLAVVRRAAMLSGDLGATARLALTSGEEALRAVSLEVCKPVLPMLAATATDVASAIESTGRSSVEWKLDGARVQVHRDGEEVRVYTRNLNDITERLGHIVNVVRAFPATSFVLDGEAIGVDDDARPQRFQDTISDFSRDTTPARNGLQAFFFDILHLDGEDLLDRPLAERADALARLAVGYTVPSVHTDDPEVAAAVLAESLANGHEGVMVKSLDSRYEAGRRGAAWLKVKPVTTLDLVVLAAEWGHGRRRGWLSNIHLGARDTSGDGFVMVGKTFKGLTDELLAWQTDRFQELATGQEGITVSVRPELVVEIALDGVQRSTRYAGGVALRFARVRRYRDDKIADEADTIDTVRALLGGPG
ncbi:MAG: ATP-dependent ligase [Actinomycetia bacterium]|nr:ATP-dependent ligase [Actinomycetes bacterium]